MEPIPGIGMFIQTVSMLMHSRHLPTAYGGIGGITPMAGVAIPIMAGAGTAGTVRAGVLAGA